MSAPPGAVPATDNLPPWFSEPGPAAPKLEGEVHADVAVVGAGITGVTAARLLAEAGATVALIEADRIGQGVSCFTTAKFSALQATKYTDLQSGFGSEAAAIYARASLDALAWVAERVSSEGISCDLRRRTAYTYAATASERDAIEREAEAARKAGLPVELIEDVPLPFETYGAVALPGQAELDPLAYVRGLAANLPADLVSVFEGSRVDSVSEGSPCRVQAGDGTVICGNVVLATLTPILDRSLAFARTTAQRSYIVALESRGEVPEGMFISAGSKLRSLRSHPAPGGRELVLVGGEGHKVGQADGHAERYETLAGWGRERFGAGATAARWSAQDFVSADHGPLIGPVNPASKRIWMATGYGKWGLTTGTAAAAALTIKIMGGTSELADSFSSNRLNPRAAAPALIKENANVGWRFFADRVRERPRRKAEELAPGEAEIAEHAGKRVAAHRDAGGVLHTVSPLCSHLACQVTWNDAERSWDCPCHGSRFAPDGHVLQGPATKPLAQVSEEDQQTAGQSGSAV